MEEIFRLDREYLAQTYRKLPVVFSRGKGIFLWDLGGKRYLDFVAGVAVSALGHADPELRKALSRQAGRLIHMTNLVYIKEQVELARELARITPGRINKFFFSNSGAESVEAALKLSIKHTGRKKIVAMEHSFHGRTLGALSATWKPSYREPFQSFFLSNVQFIPFNDLSSAERAVDEDTAAVILEPIQGEGGVRVASQEFLKGLKELCEERGALLIMDEVQTGMGRTGKWFACEHWGVEPDIITLAKALGGGVPIGCTGARPEVMESFQPGDHGATFGGNPLACVAALTVIREIRKRGLVKKAERRGRYFMKALEELKGDHPSVREVRGKGLMLGMELDGEDKAERVVMGALEEGFLINVTAGKVLRFLPPLVVEEAHIDALVSTLDGLLRKVEG
ncbi:MAG: acetylornithine transaminase [Hadesarchaea archaeon]|nr:MAG: acetylornithine transaminase [Hadesarchaea archaeon]